VRLFILLVVDGADEVFVEDGPVFALEIPRACILQARTVRPLLTIFTWPSYRGSGSSRARHEAAAAAAAAAAGGSYREELAGDGIPQAQELHLVSVQVCQLVNLPL